MAPSYAQDPTWHMLTWTIWTYQYLLHTTTSITPQFTGDNVFPAEHSEQAGCFESGRVGDTVTPGWSVWLGWPGPGADPAHPHSLQLCSCCSHHNTPTSGHLNIL